MATTALACAVSPKPSPTRREPHTPGCLASTPALRRASALPLRQRLTPRRLGAARLRAEATPSVAEAEVERQPTCLGSPQWETFAAAASGEWEGVTSTFGPDGTVRQLPDYYVPDAYKEWGVEVVDWTHMTSTLVTGEGLSNAVKKFMPTVGCEADAVAFVEESNQALKAPEAHPTEAKTISPEGSYSLGPRLLADEDAGFAKQRIESCIMGAEKERVRLVYTVQRRDATSPWKVFSLDVFKEMYVGEYEGGTDLRACGGADGYGQKPRTELPDLCGTWKRVNGLSYTCDANMAFQACEMQTEPERVVAEEGLVALPQGVWSRFSSEGADDLALESGWLFAEGQQRVVARTYGANVLTSITIAEEQKQ